jgi:hypothetical protein
MKRLEALERSINRRSRQIILEVDGNLPVDEAAEAESTALSSFATSAAAPGNA